MAPLRRRFSIALGFGEPGGWVSRAAGSPTATPHQLWPYPPEPKLDDCTAWPVCCRSWFSAWVTCGNGVIRWASVVSGKLDSMKAADRERRDAQVVQLFLAGASYRSIAGAVGLRSPQSVGNIVQREFADRRSGASC